MTLGMLFPPKDNTTWWGKFYEGFTNIFGYTKPLYSIVLFFLIIGFNYFYVSMQYNPVEIANNLRQSNGGIPGIRPGKPTADYLKRVSNRITLFGAIFLALVALIPSLVFKAIDVSLVNVFSATGLLIIVSVALEFEQALQSQIMMKNYKGFLK
jgi:preprotein translocase subunit SecY